MKIASWNVNSLRVRLSHILSWLETNQPSVLGLQETKVTDDLFPEQAIAEAGYEAVYAGQKTYNGVALMAKRAPVDIVTDLPGFEDPQRRVLAATVDKFRIINLYVPNGQAVGTEKYEYKLNWLLALRDFLDDQLKEHEHIVVMGDFNIAPEDRDVHNPKAWEGSVLCSEPERAALRKIADHVDRCTFCHQCNAVVGRTSLSLPESPERYGSNHNRLRYIAFLTRCVSDFIPGRRHW